MHIVFRFYEYFYLILHDVNDILLEFVDIQLYKLNINKDLKKRRKTNQDKPNSFRKLT